MLTLPLAQGYSRAIRCGAWRVKATPRALIELLFFLRDSESLGPPGAVLLPSITPAFNKAIYPRLHSRVPRSGPPNAEDGTDTVPILRPAGRRGEEGPSPLSLRAFTIDSPSPSVVGHSTVSLA